MNTQEAFRLVGVVEARTRAAENDLRRFDKLGQSVAKNFQGATVNIERAFFGPGKAASGFFERFSHISNIIQGIPQIGALAGAITRPLFQATEQGIKLNMVLEQAQIGYEQVAGSQDKARKFLNDLQTFGQRSPFRFEGLLQASRLMTAFGFDLDEQIPKLTIWGNAIASSGELSADKIHDVVTAFGQMRMAGRVNGQDMMQLTNANIPGWELLAKAIGKTVAETRKLSEAGRLDGHKAVEAITAMMAIDPRYKDMMARLEKTTAGRLSAAEDVLQFAQGKATRSLTGDISKTLDAALQRGDLVDSLAGKIDSTIKPISGALTGAITAMLTGDADGLKNVAKDVLGSALSNGLTEGISSGVGTVKDAIGSLVTDGVVNPFKNLLGIKSPSTVFMGFGHMAAEGFNIGFAEGLNDGTFDVQIERFLGRIEGKLSASKKRSAENLARLMEREPDFKDKLVAGSRARGINPDHLLNVMAVETAGTFNPAAKNPNSTASGLIQFMADTARDLGTTTAALRKMTATQQLDYVFKYFDDFLRRGYDLSTQGGLYAAVGAGKVGSNDQSVLMTSRDRGYAGNAATWDPNRDGIVRQGEMALAALNKLGAGVNFTVNGSTAVTTSNPMPVTIVAAAEFFSALGKQVAQGRRTGPNVGADVGIGAGLLRDAKAEKVFTMANAMREKMQAANYSQFVTTSNVMATSIMPRATQALEQMSENTDRLIKGAGEWKDVIVQSEEATRRLKVHWDGIAQSFESAFMGATAQALQGNFLGALRGFFLDMSFDVAQQFNSAFSARLSKALFDFQGSDSNATGGLVSKFLNKIGLGKVLEKAGLQPKAATSPSPVVASSAGAAMNQAMQAVADANRQTLSGRRRRAAGSVPESKGNEQKVGVDTGAGADVLRQTVQESTDKIVSGQQVQTAQMTTAMAANTDRIVDAVTPRQPGFFRGLLNAALSGAASGAAGAATGGLFSGGGSNRPDPEAGGSGTPQTGPPVLRPYDPTTRTRPRVIGQRAWGGPVTAGQTYLVGEKGPEQVRFAQSGAVYANNSALAKMALNGGHNNGGRPVVNHYHFTQHIHANDAQSIKRSRFQIERQMHSSLRRVSVRAA